MFVIHWTGWQPRDDEQQENFKNAVLQRGDEGQVKSLETIQKNRECSGEIALSTKKKRECDAAQS